MEYKLVMDEKLAPCPSKIKKKIIYKFKSDELLIKGVYCLAKKI